MITVVKITGVAAPRSIHGKTERLSYASLVSESREEYIAGLPITVRRS